MNLVTGYPRERRLSNLRSNKLKTISFHILNHRAYFLTGGLARPLLLQQHFNGMIKGARTYYFTGIYKINLICIFYGI
jgi:hypothetical protein